MVRPVLLAFLLTPALLWSQSEKDLVKARRALDDGKAYKAVRACDKALRNEDAPLVFHALRADALNRIGEWERALADARIASGSDVPLEKGAGLREAGEAWHALGNNDSAMFLLRSAVQVQDDPEAFYQLALVEAATGDETSALDHQEQALRLRPSLVKALRERGTLRMLLGDTAAGMADLERSVELDPKDPVNWNSRGYGHAMLGHHQRAIADYDKAIKLNPNYGYAFNNRGYSRLKLGDREGAMKDVRLAGRKNPGNPYVYRNMGLIALDAGDTDAACRNFRQALEQGFSARHGNEVEELMRTHCGVKEMPKPVERDAPPPEPKERNAPGAPARHNAP